MEVQLVESVGGCRVAYTPHWGTGYISRRHNDMVGVTQTAVATASFARASFAMTGGIVRQDSECRHWVLMAAPSAERTLGVRHS